MAASAVGKFWIWLKEYIPDIFITRRFNFITIHYLYLIGWSILGSVLLFSVGSLRYIDALFFASGAATQSGLNTVDIDLMFTGQQFILYLMAMFCNPIIVHSFVVFVRLYWFEKRFKDIVKEVKMMRRTKSRSRNNTQTKNDPEQGHIQKSVRGRDIEIVRNKSHLVEKSPEDPKTKPDAKAESVTSSDNTHKDSGESLDEAEKRVFLSRALPHASLVQSPEEIHLPTQLSADQHIAFLENQRNPRDTSTLRIPSPREFDRGGKPEAVESNDGPADAASPMYGPTDQPAQVNFDLVSNSEPTPTAPHITIDEPNIFIREKLHTFPTRPGTDRSTDGSQHSTERKRPRRNTFSSVRRTNTKEALDGVPYLDFQPTIGRNSFFVGLTEEERDKLGGIEYRALKTLAIILICYFVAWHLIGVICLLPWILRTPTYGKVVTNQGQGRIWWAIFTAASAFNDLGFTLTNDSMIEFGTAVLPMLLMTFLIVIGNTGFPCMLRLTIWVMSKVVGEGSPIWEELRFLLDHPRRCFTLLFPSGATWWLFTILVILNGLDLIFFIVLDLNDPIITVMSPGIRFIDGLFQASSTRTAGFSVVNLAELHPAIQVSYLIMMYISVFPIAISMRRTNVYEEKSLGIYGSKQDDDEEDKDPSYVGAHLRKQLSFDLWYVFLGLFIIAIVEGPKLQNTHLPGFTLFSVLFEIVSAYGTVGLSLGYPNINASFSAEFTVLSKLVIVAMQIRGRHRGLPYELDRAILLPSESLHEKEKEEGERIMARRRSSIAMSDTSAVDDMNPRRNFRPETGLASGHYSKMNGVRERSRSTPTDGTEGAHSGLGDGHRSHVRQGLGRGLFKLATHPEVGESMEKKD